MTNQLIEIDEMGKELENYCPYCGAEPNTPCTNEGTELGLHIHKERNNLFISTDWSNNTDKIIINKVKINNEGVSNV